MLKKISFKRLRIIAKYRIPSPYDFTIILVLNVLITIPVFLIAHQKLIDLNWFYQLDRVLLFIIIVAVIQVTLHAMRKITFISIFVYLSFLGYGTLIGGYSFNSIFEDYRAMIFAMQKESNPEDVVISKLLPFPNKSKIIDAVNYYNPKVRNFALYATTEHFREIPVTNANRKMIQCFAIFKEIKSRWNYVSDPKGREYIASASESLQHFSGDCDDHAILMAATLRAIGGTPRLIHTKGHIYPEMLLENRKELEMALYLIQNELFVEESKDKLIHYHADERGKFWLNLDYTAAYPGGPFMKEEILGELTFD